MKFAFLVAYSLVVFQARSPVALGACCAVAVIAACALRLGLRGALALMRPVGVIVVATAVAQVFYVQSGVVFAWLGPVAVTEGALVEIARMTARLLCVTVASAAFMRCTNALELARAFGWFILPLRRLGVRTDGIEFSLSVAFGFVPTFVSDFRQMRQAHMARHAAFGGGLRMRLVAYTRLFALLVRSAFRRADTLADAAASRCLGCGPSSMEK